LGFCKRIFRPSDPLRVGRAPSRKPAVISPANSPPKPRALPGRTKRELLAVRPTPQKQVGNASARSPSVSACRTATRSVSRGNRPAPARNSSSVIASSGAFAVSNRPSRPLANALCAPVRRRSGRCRSCGTLAGASRRPLRAARTATEVRLQPRVGQLHRPHAGRVAGELVRHTRRDDKRPAAPRPAADGRSSASRSACRRRWPGGSPLLNW